MALKDHRLIDELLARKWYVASVLFPLVSLWAGYVAESHDREAARIQVQAAQEFVEGGASEIPRETRLEIRSHTFCARQFRRSSSGTFFAGLFVLVISIRECEPGRRLIPAVLSVIAGLLLFDLL
jgi:hypothetical protein